MYPWMRRTVVAGSLATLLWMLLAACASAQPEAEPQPPTELSYLDRIGVDDETRQELSSLVRDATRRGNEIRRKIAVANRELQALLRAESPDEAVVLAKADEIGALQLAEQQNRLRATLAFRAKLSSEQRRELARLRKAREQARQSASRTPCTPDLERLCPERASGAEVARCLAQHWDALSPGCRARFGSGAAGAKAGAGSGAGGS